MIRYPRILIGFSLIILASLMAFGLFTVPKSEKIGSSIFSAERVVKDIEYISKEPHSIEHPIERNRVRDYLCSRLEDMGGNPIVLQYDSVSSSIADNYSIGNIFCEFNTLEEDASSYVLFVAHLDSRYAESKFGKKVYSNGAADDGYGLGVILELVSQSLKYREQWKQGVKILFTDAEEVGMQGMRYILNNDEYVFDAVGLVVNIEAKGVRGPALMFETSSDNRHLMDLYSYAKYPYAYSLTNAVYEIMPNFTDFTLLKADYPGFNFSVIDNELYYHTELDNFSNINSNSIQHYGAQLEPIVEKFLIGDEYSDPNYLKAEKNDIFFSIPGLGMLVFTKFQYFIFTFFTIILFLFTLFLHINMGNIRPMKMLKKSISLFFVSVLILGIGEGLAYLIALINGVDFNIVNTRYIEYAPHIYIGTIALLLIIVLFFFKKKMKKRYLKYEYLFGILTLLAIFSLILLFIAGENFFFLMPLLLASLAMLFHLVVYMNFTSIVAIAFILLSQLSFLYLLATALTIGALGIVLFLAFFNIVLVIILFYTFLTQKY